MTGRCMWSGLTEPDQRKKSDCLIWYTAYTFLLQAAQHTTAVSPTLWLHIPGALRQPKRQFTAHLHTASGATSALTKVRHFAKLVADIVSFLPNCTSWHTQNKVQGCGLCVPQHAGCTVLTERGNYCMTQRMAFHKARRSNLHNTSFIRACYMQGSTY